MRKFHHWTNKEKDILRREYDHTGAGASRLAARLRVSLGAVKGQVDLLGLATPRRVWSPEERTLLAELITKYCPSRVAKIMRRSINAVTGEAVKLKLSRRARDSWYTATDVAYIFGVSRHWVSVRVRSGALKAYPHNPHHLPTKQGGSPWHIKEKDLVEFIRKHPQELRGHNVDMVTLVDLLGGLE